MNMRLIITALALSLGSPLAAFSAPTPPQAAPPSPAAHAPPDPKDQAVQEWHDIAAFYRAQAIAANDQLAVALARCGAPCAPPPPQQRQ